MPIFRIGATLPHVYRLAIAHLLPHRHCQDSLRPVLPCGPVQEPDADRSVRHRGRYTGELSPVGDIISGLVGDDQMILGAQLTVIELA